MRILLLIVLLLGGAIVYPRYAEHTNDVCGALGKRLEQISRAGRQQAPQIPYEDLARAEMQARYPQVPEMLRCAAGYWIAVADPDVGEVAKRVAPFMAGPK